MVGTFKALLCALALLVVASDLLFPQTRSISWSTFNMGLGVSSSTSHGIKSAIGQSFVDNAQQSGVGVGSGFLADTLLSRLIFSGSISVSGSWNLISVPVIAPSYQKSFLFPSASSVAFGYTAGYVRQDILQQGMGYWLKFPFDQTVNFIGTTVSRESIKVDSHWNMIGSLSLPIAVGNISSIPGGLVTSGFFGYDPSTGYRVADSIKPGVGYWVRANQSGQLILSTSLNLLSTNRIVIVPDAELPPSPPEGTRRSDIPKEFALQQNYPNPFNPNTVIRYQLPVDSRVKLKIYNVLGQEVKSLVDEVQKAGYWSAKWNPMGGSTSVASGVYVYRIEAVSLNYADRSFVQFKKMLLVR